MGYIDKNLMSGEHVLHRSSLHWIVFLWPFAWFTVALICFAGGRETAPAGIFFLLIAIIMSLFAFINFSTSEFGLTNKRVIVKVGFIRRSSIEVLLDKIEGIQVNQGILGRMLNYGSIIVSGTGGTKDPFHKISAPLEFRKKVQEQISSVQVTAH